MSIDEPPFDRDDPRFRDWVLDRIPDFRPYLDRDGNPISLRQWGELHQQEEMGALIIEAFRGHLTAADLPTVIWGLSGAFIYAACTSYVGPGRSAKDWVKDKAKSLAAALRPPVLIPAPVGA